jgi:CRP-like cAMP-binding protein
VVLCSPRCVGCHAPQFEPFAPVDEYFLAQLATKLSLQVFMPQEKIMENGQMYSCAYFITRGVAQAMWADTSLASMRSDVNDGGGDTYNVVHLSDYFGEVGLFLKTELHYLVRAKTHLDTYSLERDDFQDIMRQRPSAAVVVADRVTAALPAKVARQVRRDIYAYAGLSDFLPARFYRWQPPPGFASRLLEWSRNPKNIERLQKARQTVQNKQEQQWRKKQSIMRRSTATALSSLSEDSARGRLFAAPAGAPSGSFPPKMPTILDDEDGVSHSGRRASSDSPFSRRRSSVLSGGTQPARPKARNASTELKSVATVQTAIEGVLQMMLSTGAADVRTLERAMHEITRKLAAERELAQPASAEQRARASPSGGSIWPETSA